MALDKFDTIFTQFPPADAQRWKEKIVAELKSGDYENLISANADGIPVHPFYTAEDSDRFRLDIPLKKTNGWLITERVRVNDPVKANTDALNALQNGAMSLLIDLQQHKISADSVKILLQDIQLDIAPVYFENYLVEDRSLLSSLAAGSCPETIPVPQLECKSDELAFAIAKSLSSNSAHLLVHFSIGGNYFMEIAKLRAFRWLWGKLNELHGTSKSMTLLCETGFQQRSGDDENKNILRNTTEAMSAVIGGCDALLVNPHDHREDSAFGKRIARNVQNILLYESGFGELNDTGRGVYFIEYLTYSLSNKVWEKLSAS